MLEENWTEKGCALSDQEKSIMMYMGSFWKVPGMDQTQKSSDRLQQKCKKCESVCE